MDSLSFTVVEDSSIVFVVMMSTTKHKLSMKRLNKSRRDYHSLMGICVVT